MFAARFRSYAATAGFFATVIRTNSTVSPTMTPNPTLSGRNVSTGLRL